MTRVEVRCPATRNHNKNIAGIKVETVSCGHLLMLSSDDNRDDIVVCSSCGSVVNITNTDAYGMVLTVHKKGTRFPSINELKVVKK